MATKNVSRSTKRLKKGKKLEATKPLSLYGSTTGGKHIPNVTVT